MTRFANLKDSAANNDPAPPMPHNLSGQQNRQGRKAISGYFSPQMSVAMRSTALRNGVTLQEAMAEAFNDWLRKNGESPIGD